MEHVNLNIDHVGVGCASGDWFLKNRIKMQRLYYIIGGKGYFRDSNGEYVTMEQGKVYIFPYNFYSEFKTDKLSPIKHLYFDFISSPPIISDEPLEVDVDSTVGLSEIISYTVKILEHISLSKMTEAKISYIHFAKSGSFDEQRQTVYGALYQILLTISANRAIPFSEDSIVTEAIEYIRENPNADLSLDALSVRLNFDKHHFIRRFKRIMNETPHVYIKKCRLLLAKELLEDGIGYDEAAKRVGYKSGKSLWNAMNSK